MSDQPAATQRIKLQAQSLRFALCAAELAAADSYEVAAQ
jgi:hypothetical protein